MSENHTFPWGIYIGDLIDNNDTIPLCLDSKQGGFCVLFDESSEQIANNFIENVALKLLEVIKLGELEVNIFDFGRKRFMYLSEFQNAKLCDIAYSSNISITKFNSIEEIANYRLQELFSNETRTLSEYNEQNSIRERYHLLLVNLDDFPDDMSSHKQIKRFFDSAYEAGFYTIAFGNREILESESKATQAILNQFPHLSIENREFKFTKELFEFADMLEDYAFEYVNDKRDKIVENLLSQLEKEEESSSEQDFLSVPIGTSLDGRQKVYFRLGLKSVNYHAFIAGKSGSGKSNLLKAIIMGIAEKYTSKEIELYLIDYKGTDFKLFKNHPNCRKLFLGGDGIEASIAILEEFNSEIGRRRELFLVDDRINNIDRYNELIPESSLARQILIIDEVQNLFKGNRQEIDTVSRLLEKVMREGRAFGLHIILATQHLKDIDIGAILEDMHLRIALEMRESVANKILDFDNTKIVKEIHNFRFVYNSRSGMKDGNLIVQQAEYKEDIATIFDELQTKRDRELVLTPEIVESSKEENREDSQSSFEQRDRENRYDTSEQKEFLKKYGFEPRNFVDEGGV